MESFAPDDVLRLFLALGILLAAARLGGEFVRRFGQPAVLGEIAAGIVLGPTVLGRLAPESSIYLFPLEGPVAVALEALKVLAVTLFLLAAGMEVDLSAILRRGRTTLAVASGGIVAPFALGYAFGRFAPERLGMGASVEPEVFALFFAIALSISALPVIAKTLMDLHLYRTDLGVVVIGAAVLNDLVGWLLFAVVLASAGGDVGTLTLPWKLGLTLAFTAAMLTVVRWLIHKSLPFVLAYSAWPGGVLAFALSLGLFSAAFTSFSGVHAMFGAFLAGVALGDSAHLRERTRATIQDFVSHFFAPLFFGSIGLAIDFAANFDLVLCGAVLAVACLGKIAGCGIAARWSGVDVREAWAIGCAMNARGSMEIVLGSIALQVGLIGAPLFVALVVMALATSLMSGPILQRLTRRTRTRELVDYLTPRAFVRELRARDRRGVIAELAATLVTDVGDDAQSWVERVWAREQTGPTGLGEGIAVPHARIPKLAGPRLALGLSDAGVDFDALDGLPARIVVLVLTPDEATGAQLEILSGIGDALQHPVTRELLLRARTYTELCAVLQTRS